MTWGISNNSMTDDKKFTFKNGGITSTSHMSPDEIANTLFANTRAQEDEKRKKQRKKDELLNILGDKATSADILLRTPEELEKRISEEGLGRRKGLFTGGASEVEDTNSSKIPLPGDEYKVKTYLGDIEDIEDNEDNKDTNKIEAPLPGNETKTKSHSGDKEAKEKEEIYQPKMFDKISEDDNANSNRKDLQDNQAPFKLHAQYDDTSNNNEVNVSNVKSKIQDENFNKIIKYTHEAEGGFVDNKNDRGGRTNMGVTQRTFDAYNKKMNRPLKDVKNITKDEANEIYYKEYYLASGADKIKDKNLRYLHYDAAINHGVGRAKKFLQQSGGDFDKYMKLRNNFYDDIVKDKPKQKEFLKGWNNRTGKIQKMKDENILED